MAELIRDRGRSAELPREYEGQRDDVGLKTLLSRLSSDVTQLAHDELELAKLELRDIADALRDDIRDASRTVVKDVVKVGMALSLALMAGLALTAGAVLAVGALLNDNYWAGAFIVGVVLLVAAVVAAKSAASDAQESDALRLRNTKRTLARDGSVLRDEVRETKDFAAQQAQEFKRHASPGNGSTHAPH